MTTKKKAVAKAPRARYRHADGVGVIESGKAYSLNELKKNFGIAGKWLRNARDNGLKTAPLGRQVCIRGDELLRYIQQQEK